MTNAVAEDRASVPTALLTPQQVADTLQCSRAKVYALIAEGRLPGVVRIVGSIRIDRASLVRWLAEQAAESAVS